MLVGKIMSESDFKGIKIALIDDDQSDLETVESLLKEVGCDVVTAIDGFESLSKVTDVQPNLIFVDVMMPRIDGYKTCFLLKNNDAFKNTPIVMLLEKDSVFEHARAKLVGANDYIIKPVTKDNILSSIETYINIKN
jgi:twitching motility two-component system response regulator PilG